MNRVASGAAGRFGLAAFRVRRDSVRAIRNEFTEERNQLNYARLKIESDNPLRSVEDLAAFLEQLMATVYSLAVLLE